MYIYIYINYHNIIKLLIPLIALIVKSIGIAEQLSHDPKYCRNDSCPFKLDTDRKHETSNSVY